MITYNELDERTPFNTQLERKVGPVAFLNIFKIDPKEALQFERAWAEDAAFFQKQPGCISAQLHRVVGDKTIYVNYALWETSDQFRTAVTSDAFKVHRDADPPSTTAVPTLLQRLHVPDVCLGEVKLGRASPAESTT